MPALSSHDDTDDLLERTNWGDAEARDILLERHRARLRTMIAVRMDRRIRARVDPSDVVQDVLQEAASNLGDNVRDRPVPFLAWLREIAWKRLVDLRRRHVGAAKRSVVREQGFDFGPADESTAALADRLVASGTSPSKHLMEEELRSEVRTALEALPPLDHQVLILRYLGRLSLAETVEAPGISKGAASTRHTRALARLRVARRRSEGGRTMKSRSRILTFGSAMDRGFNAVVEQLADKLQAGEVVDLDAYLLRYPEQAEKHDRVVPTIALMADLGRSVDPPASPGGGSAPDAAQDGPARHRLLGNFRLVREIGRGGMAIVYEAEQMALRRRVALKVLLFSAVPDSRHRERFQLEARAATLLHHPHIVPVHAVGSEDDQHYHTMPLIEGPSLEAVIREPRRRHRPDPMVDGGVGNDPETTPTVVLPLRSASADKVRDFYRAGAHRALQAAEALDDAHRNRVIHRDIKPTNLLLDRRGHLWVTDFGLARMQEDSDLTRTGDLVWTLRYMSLEQALGKSVVIDHRTDIYSLGVTLYELLTLTPAISGPDRQDDLNRIAHEEPRPPLRIVPAIPKDLETIVLKAIAKERDGR